MYEATRTRNARTELSVESIGYLNFLQIVSKPPVQFIVLWYDKKRIQPVFTESQSKRFFIVASFSVPKTNDKCNRDCK